MDFNLGEMKMKKRIGILLGLVMLVNCSKPMEERCVQGNCLSDLQQLHSNESTSYYTLETGKEILENQDHIASNADNLIIDKDYDVINNFPIVEFTTDPFIMKYLSGVQFRGRPDFTYEIVIEVTKDHLIIYKVGHKKDIPSQEWSYARSVRPDGRMVIPLLAYNINLIRLEYVEDTRGQLTQERREFPAYDLDEATHYKVDLTNRQEFKRPNKKDVFPKDILDGEWYFTSVVVFNPANLPTGRINDSDFSFSPASKIVFKAEQDGLVGYNINVDKDVDINQWQNLTEVISIPASWVDFKIQTVGKQDVMREILLSGTDDFIDISAEWNERSYVRLDLAKSRTAISSKMNVSAGNTKLYELELASNYMSFVVEYEKEKLRIRYSFLKVHDRKVTPRIYHLDDIVNSFGLFFNQQNYIPDYRYYRRKDISDQLLLNRFYPKANEKGERIIKYYFTKRSSPLFDDVAVKAIHYWDQAHVRAETGIRLKMIPREEKEVSLGDLRYNAINTLDLDIGTLGSGDARSILFGYGPSIIDSQTGEIISAVANTYVSPFRTLLFSLVENFIRAQKGVFEKQYLDSISDTILFNPISAIGGEKLFDFQSHDDHFSEQDIGKHEDNDTLLNPSELMKRAISDSGSLKLSCDFHYGAVYKDFIKTVEESCVGPGSVMEFLDKNDYSGVLDRRDEEKDAILSCVEKIIKPIVRVTLTHEVGHNMNLTHNFRASTDAANYSFAEDGSLLAATSSVMDYSPLHSREEFVNDPYPYDIAAIRYGYKGEIEVREKSGEEKEYVAHTVPNGQSIDEFLDRHENFQRRPYLYCSDVGEKYKTHDPLCRTRDIGSTPLEIVQSMINEINSIYAINGHRLDRDYGPIPFFLNRYMADKLAEMRVFYDQWRYYLSKYIYEVKGNMEPYLHTYDNESYARLMNDIQFHPVYSKHYKDYYPAAKAVFDFYKSLIETPSRHCMVWHREKGENSSLKKLVRFFEFYHLRKRFVYTIISDCNEPNVEEYLKSQYPLPAEYDGENFETVITSVGKHLRDFRKTGDLDNEDYKVWTIPGSRLYFNEQEDCERRLRGSGIRCAKKQERVDVVGLSSLRHMALNLMISRNQHPQLLIHKRDSFAPNMLDDPFHSQEILSYFKKRLFFGLDSNSFFEKPSTEENETSFIPVYDVESHSDFLVNLFHMIRGGLSIPGEVDASFDRYDDFYALKSTGYTDINNEASYTQYEIANVVNLRSNNTYYVAAPKDNTSRTSFQMITIYKRLKRDMDFFRLFTRNEWKKLKNSQEEIAEVSDEEFCTHMSEMEQMNFDEIKRGLSCLPIPSLKEMSGMTVSSFHQNRLFLESQIRELKSAIAVKVYTYLIVDRSTQFLNSYNSIKDDSANMDEFLETYGDKNLLSLLFELHSISDEQKPSIPPSDMFNIIAGLVSEDKIDIFFLQQMEIPYRNVIAKNYLENEHEYIPQLDMLTRILLAL